MKFARSSFRILLILPVVILAASFFLPALILAADSTTIEYNYSLNIKRVPDDTQVVNDVVKYSLLAETTTVAVAQVATTVSMVQSFNILEYLKYFFTFVPVKKKGKRDFWGIIYDSATFLPVAFAVVRIFDTDSDKLIITTVSDISGKYGIILDPGNYYIKVEHQDYNFPVTSGVKGIAGNDLNIYAGGKFTVKEQEGINFNIPLELKQLKKGFSFGKIRRWWKGSGLATISSNGYFICFFFLLNLGLLYYSFSIIYLILTIYYMIFLIMFLYSYISKPPRMWGRVLSTAGNTAVAFAFIKVYVKDSEQLVDTMISDKRGRFQFFMSNGKYTLHVEAAGFTFPAVKYQATPALISNNQLQLTVKNNALNLDLFVDPIATANNAAAVQGQALLGPKFGYSQTA